MNHFTLPRFWRHYRDLPRAVRRQADRCFERMKADPHHPSLHLKKIGRSRTLWSARVGEEYRAVARERPEGLVWFWIGTHAEYDRLIEGDRE